MTEYYKQMLAKGQEYERYVAPILEEEFGIKLNAYKTQEEQFNIGENKEGIEIKFDDMLEKTGNIYIEVEEKSASDGYQFTPSGIFRGDNSWLYLIGNKDRFFIFEKSILIKAYMGGGCQIKKISTSTGFILNINEAINLSCVNKIINQPRSVFNLNNLKK